MKKNTEHPIQRVVKVKPAGIDKLEAENNRHPGEYIASDIDWSKTPNNRYFVRSDNWRETIEKILKEHGIFSHRKDAIPAVSTVYTATPSFFDGKSVEAQDQFFAACLDYHRRHYGHLIINAVVHVDETSLHMHVVSIPIVKNENGGYSLSARKALGTRQDYYIRQSIFQNEMATKFDLVPCPTKDRRQIRANINTLNLKYQTLIEKNEIESNKLEKLISQAAEIEKDIRNSELKLSSLVEFQHSIDEKADALVCCVNKIISGCTPFINSDFATLVSKIENRESISLDDLRAAHCKMIPSSNGNTFLPVTYDGTQLTWDSGRQAFYVRGKNGYDYHASGLNNQIMLWDNEYAHNTSESICKDLRDFSAFDLNAASNEFANLLDELYAIQDKISDIEKVNIPLDVETNNSEMDIPTDCDIAEDDPDDK